MYITLVCWCVSGVSHLDLLVRFQCMLTSFAGVFSMYVTLVYWCVCSVCYLGLVVCFKCMQPWFVGVFQCK